MSDNCDRCSFCVSNVWETPFRGYYCVNEESLFFGKVVRETNSGGPGCNNRRVYDPKKIADIGLKDALIRLIQPDEVRTIHKFRFDKDDDVFAALFFKSNKDYILWRDALERCFVEYLNLSKEEKDRENKRAGESE